MFQQIRWNVPLPAAASFVELASSVAAIISSSLPSETAIERRPEIHEADANANTSTNPNDKVRATLVKLIGSLGILAGDAKTIPLSTARPLQTVGGKVGHRK